MKLFLARHGTTLANREKRFQGLLDFPLSIEGRREAFCLAQRLAPLALDGIYSSDLSRAGETARIIARKNKALLRFTPLLRESCWGVIEGLTRAEIAVRYPYLIQNWRAGKTPFIPGAESKRRLRGRCRLLLRRLKGCYASNASLLLVSHGRFINALIAAVLGWPVRCRWPFVSRPAALSLLQQPVPGGRWDLLFFNDCRHLTKRLYPGTHLR